MPSHHTGEIILKFKSLFYLCYILYFILPRPRLLPLPLLEGFYYLLKHEVARDLMDDMISVSLFSIWTMLGVNRTCLYHINMHNVSLLWHFRGLCFVACPQASLPQCSNANCYQIYCPKRCTCIGRALGVKQ